MKRCIGSLFLMVSLLTLAGCNSLPEVGTVAAGGAGGAALAHELSDGDLGWTALGAAAGSLAGMGAAHLIEENEREAYQAGYDAGRNQAVKQQYWMLQNQQRESSLGNTDDTAVWVPITLPEEEVDGVRLAERTIYIRAR